MPGRFVCTAAICRRVGTHDVRHAVTEGRPLRELFSRAQRELLAAHAPANVGIDDLVVFGPVDVRRGKVLPARLGRPLTIERWTYPDGSGILELSTRCAAAHALPVAARMASMLNAHRIVVTGPQQTKTRATLAYFGSLAQRRSVLPVTGTRPPAVRSAQGLGVV